MKCWSVKRSQRGIFKNVNEDQTKMKRSLLPLINQKDNQATNLFVTKNLRDELDNVAKRSAKSFSGSVYSIRRY